MSHLNLSTPYAALPYPSAKEHSCSTAVATNVVYIVEVQRSTARIQNKSNQKKNRQCLEKIQPTTPFPREPASKNRDPEAPKTQVPQQRAVAYTPLTANADEHPRIFSQCIFALRTSSL